MTEHKLWSAIRSIDRTHSGLGRGVAFGAICSKAKICMIIIAPSGCGKSSISEAIANAHPETIKLDSVTRAGLRDFKGELDGYRGLIIVDDLGKVDTPYSRISTVTSFAELCYSHFVRKHTMSVTVQIEDFQGSAILNSQPPILAQLVASDEWEVVIQDKTIRYYHLLRPVTPNADKPVFNVDWGIHLDLVKRPRRGAKGWASLEKIASVQWSDARVNEHVANLLRASAALDRRKTVNQEDYRLLKLLMAPMTVESEIINKEGFETFRFLNNNLLAVFVEFASWKELTVGRIARDYKIHPSTVYRLLSNMPNWFVTTAKSPTTISPTKQLKATLRRAGVL